MTGRTMQENWSLGRRKSCAVGLLTCKKVDTEEESNKKADEDDPGPVKERKRSQSLVTFSRQTQ